MIIYLHQSLVVSKVLIENKLYVLAVEEVLSFGGKFESLLNVVNDPIKGSGFSDHCFSKSGWTISCDCGKEVMELTNQLVGFSNILGTILFDNLVTIGVINVRSYPVLVIAGYELDHSMLS